MGSIGAAPHGAFPRQITALSAATAYCSLARGLSDPDFRARASWHVQNRIENFSLGQAISRNNSNL